MSGGEAFVILAAAEIAVRERRGRRPKPMVPERRRGGSLVTRSWIELLVAAGASIIILLMVVISGIVAESVASAAAPEASSTLSVPDPLTLCNTVNEQTKCVREPT
jgi:hypothetical protein